MEPLSNLGKVMAVGGLVLFIAGIFLWVGGRLPFIGKLPGDLSYKGKNFSFYFPLATSILLSALLSLILYIVRRFF